MSRVIGQELNYPFYFILQAFFQKTLIKKIAGFIKNRGDAEICLRRRLFFLFRQLDAEKSKVNDFDIFNKSEKAVVIFACQMFFYLFDILFFTIVGNDEVSPSKVIVCKVIEI